ncbi:MAG: S41 family peptidase [Marinifilaceae bacterium]
MKKLLLNATLVFLILSCSKDNKNSSTTPSETLTWIETTMRKDYLWNNEINKTLDYSQDAKTFFASMLSASDGNSDNNYYYSYIEPNDDYVSKASPQTISYGLDYIQYKVSNEYLYQIIAVYPNSPAFGKIKRGDCIMYKDNKTDSSIKEYSALQSGGATTLGLVSISYDDEKQKYLIDNKNVRWVAIDAARAIDETPLLLDTIYNYGSQRVGYIVFNSFYKPGDYDQQLENIFEKFQTKGVNKLVVDVRYNPGGYLTTLNKLSSLIMPYNGGKVLCMLQNNREEKIVYKFESPKTKNNIEDIVVLTSRYSASASEALIHCLKPYNSGLYVIGEETEGKNVASQEYKDNKYPWILHPITAKVLNSNDVQSSSNGINPDKYLQDVGEIIIKEFGDKEERLLNAALVKWNLVQANATTTTTAGTLLKPIQSSLLNKSRISGMRITERP